jgi:hypothetical protein
LGHLVFITHIKGNAVKLGPQQFPELHARVVELSNRAGLSPPPDAYLMQAGGSLNALATKLFRGRVIVLFTDLLDACGDDTGARDMVIGHEIGHLRSGHLNWLPLLAPGRLVPFLGAAYSRACEYTCDRWGAALCGDTAASARGLAILAAGGRHAARVNLKAFVDQRRDLDTGWLTIGRWLSTYPPLAARVAAIEPSTAPVPFAASRGKQRAAWILVAMVAIPGSIGVGLATYWTARIKPLFAATEAARAELADFKLEHEHRSAPGPVADVGTARAQVKADFAEISKLLREHYGETQEKITTPARLAEVWTERRPGQAVPVDPFDQNSYGLMTYVPDAVQLLSAGPDGRSWTGDDVELQVSFED